MKPPKGKVVDHINRITYDNRRDNLRVCDNKENVRNQSVQKNSSTGFTGVIYLKNDNRYKAEIKYEGNTIYLGVYKNIEDAIKVRKEAEEKYFGEFAPGNNN
ncbi:hypothetical protein D3C85_1556080 [compost metagenome]